MLRLLAKLRLIKLVWLNDFQGTKYLTVKRKSGLCDWCYVYPYTFVGHVILNGDGSCSGKSIYIETWESWC